VENSSSSYCFLKAWEKAYPVILKPIHVKLITKAGEE